MKKTHTCIVALLIAISVFAWTAFAVKMYPRFAFHGNHSLKDYFPTQQVKSVVLYEYPWSNYDTIDTLSPQELDQLFHLPFPTELFIAGVQHSIVREHSLYNMNFSRNRWLMIISLDDGTDLRFLLTTYPKISDLTTPRYFYTVTDSETRRQWQDFLYDIADPCYSEYLKAQEKTDLTAQPNSSEPHPQNESNAALQ